MSAHDLQQHERRSERPVASAAPRSDAIAAPACAAPVTPAVQPRDTLSDALMAAVAARSSTGAVLMRATGGTAVADPGQRVSPEELALLMNAYRVNDPGSITALLVAADDDVAGLKRLGDALVAKGCPGTALAAALLARAEAGQLANLVAATRYPQQLPQLLDRVPHPDVLRTLLLFEDDRDPTWLVRVCSAAPRAELQMLPTLLLRMPRALAPDLLERARPSVLFGVLPAIDDPAHLVTLLALFPDPAVLRRCLALERRGRVLAPICTVMRVDCDDVPTLLERVADRDVLLRLVSAEGDGRVLVRLLDLAREPAALVGLLLLVRNRNRLELCLDQAGTALGRERAAAAIEQLIPFNLLWVTADAGRLQRALGVIELAQGVNFATEQERADTLREALDEAESFDYHWEFGLEALANAAATRAAAIDAETKRLAALQAGEEQGIRKTHTAAASKSGGGLSQTHIKGLAKPPGGDDFQKASAALTKLVDQAAKSELDAVGLKYRQLLDAFKQGPAEQLFAARSQAYRDYYKAVGYDSDALNTLAAAGGDFAAAGRIHAAVTTLPGLRQAALDKHLNAAELERLVSLANPPRDALVAALDVTTLRQFAGSTERISLLAALGAGGAGAAKIKSCGPRLANLDGDNTAGQHAALAALLQAYEPIEVERLLKLTPGGNKPGYLNGFRPCAQDRAALEACLALGRRVGLTQTDLTSAVAAAGAAATASALRQAIRTWRDAQFPAALATQTEFADWMAMVSLMLEEKLCSITYGVTTSLPAIEGLAFTTETTCTVTPLGRTFVLHTHPYVNINSYKSSRYHVKPVTGNALTPHLYSNTASQNPKMPLNVQGKLPSLNSIKDLNL